MDTVTEILTDLRHELTEVTREWASKLEVIEREAANNRRRGYDFAGPCVNLYSMIIQLEARKTTLERVLARFDTAKATS
jgi:hypothetical protein